MKIITPGRFLFLGCVILVLTSFFLGMATKQTLLAYAMEENDLIFCEKTEVYDELNKRNIHLDPELVAWSFNGSFNETTSLQNETRS